MWGWWNDNCMRLSASLAFYTALSLAPLVVIVVGVAGWLRQRFFSLAIVFAIAFLLLVSLAVSAALAGVVHYLQGPELTRTLLSRGLEVTVSILVITYLFALLFRYVPDAEIHWRDVWLGGFVSAVLFTVGKVGIGYYIGRASIGSAYGAAGSLIALLVWVYYSSLIVFFGAEFTHAWARRQRTVEPMSYAESGAAPQTKSEAAAEQAAHAEDYDR